MAGPLAGVKVVEFAGLGPGPFTAMMLADMGAEVLRVQRAGADAVTANPVVGRGMQSTSLDLKSSSGLTTALALVDQADVLVEAFRPGVMERLGLGPDVCLARNPRLVYGRMTGWGQSGPLAPTAGHDINYIALTGALSAIGTPDSGPVPPLNLVGDFGGGGMVLAFGIACGVFAAARSGRGQVIDAAMTDGASLLMATTYGQYAAGRWTNAPASNLLDGAAHFYTTYRCADGKWVAVGAIEPQFYACLLERLGLPLEDFSPQMDRSRWPEWKERLGQVFATQTRDRWCALLDGVDACLTPVLDLHEAPWHPHNLARRTFVEHEGVCQPAPAPRFSVTAPELRPRGQMAAQDVLARWGAATTTSPAPCRL